MPTYDYACKSCGPFEVVRRIAERDLPASCARCGAASARAWLVAPRLADMPVALRFASATNERARHEPQHSSLYRHPSGCGCCAKAGGGALAGARGRMDAPGPVAVKSFAGRRPWMISH